MSEFFQSATLILLVANLAASLYIAGQVREHHRPRGLRAGNRPEKQKHHWFMIHKSAVAGFSIWEHKDHHWILLQGCGQPGCDCGPPPQTPGAFEGQVVRKECPPR